VLPPLKGGESGYQAQPLPGATVLPVSRRPSRRLLGSWVLPSGNTCRVYLVAGSRVEFEWDRPPSPSWPDEDRVHYRAVAWPEIVRAVATATGQPVLGVSL
jgi:hypothetical protein